ncbi:MAG: hypothetical protein LBD54_02775 [Puniceicoccales bacterium]|jgi:hypothetical protein|nr:hypothetical protein [Puniceicoccales bacterium]
MGFDRLNGLSFGNVQARVAANYSGAFSGVRAFFATVAHCIGFNQGSVQQALNQLTTSAVSQTPLRNIAAFSTAATSGTTGTKTVEPNSPEVQEKLTGIELQFSREIMAFRLKTSAPKQSEQTKATKQPETNVSKGVLQELSGKLDAMLAEFYSKPLDDSSNATAVHNAIYALKEKIDTFLAPHAGVVADQVIDGTKAFQQEILGEAMRIGNLAEWGNI